MANYIIYTDGSCRANGQGGIGVVWLKNGEKVFEYANVYKNVTNNQMELLAIFYGLAHIKKPIDSLEIISDSEYAIGVLSKGWNITKNTKLINIIKKLINAKQRIIKEPIIWTHVKGHQSDKWNNYCDKLAQFQSTLL